MKFRNRQKEKSNWEIKITDDCYDNYIEIFNPRFYGRKLFQIDIILDVVQTQDIDILKSVFNDITVSETKELFQHLEENSKMLQINLTKIAS